MNYKKKIKYLFKKLIKTDLKKYFYINKIDKLLNLSKYQVPKIPKPYQTYKEEFLSKPFAPDCKDLSRLHSIITIAKSLNVLEFGSGHSTKVMADALLKNKNNYGKKINLIRRSNPFKVYSIESEKKYMSLTKSVLPKKLKKHTSIFHSNTQLINYKDHLCGCYSKLPQICPDLIYIDGPSPYSYRNSKNFFFNLSHPDTTNVTCDLLRIEHFLLPATIVIFDGMTNNARFNYRLLERDWLVHEDTINDYTIMILNENPLGIHHKNHLDLVFS